MQAVVKAGLRIRCLRQGDRLEMVERSRAAHGDWSRVADVGRNDDEAWPRRRRIR